MKNKDAMYIFIGTKDGRGLKEETKVGRKEGRKEANRFPQPVRLQRGQLEWLAMFFR